MNTQIQNEKGLDSNPEHPEDKSGIKKWRARTVFVRASPHSKIRHHAKNESPSSRSTARYCAAYGG